MELVVVIIGMSVLAVLGIFLVTSKNKDVKAVISNNGIVRSLKQINAERKYLRRLKRQLRWANNRLVEDPKCRFSTKMSAVRILTEISRLDSKFPGTKRDLKRWALEILERVAQSRGLNNPKVRESAQRILDLHADVSRKIASIIKENKEPVFIPAALLEAA